MILLTTFALAAEAELARAQLDAAGIPAWVADNSAMREMADFRLMVEADRITDAAELLGVAVPPLAKEPPAWTGLAAGIVGAIVLIAVAVALFT